MKFLEKTILASLFVFTATAAQAKIIVCTSALSDGRVVTMELLGAAKYTISVLSPPAQALTTVYRPIPPENGFSSNAAIDLEAYEGMDVPDLLPAVLKRTRVIGILDTYYQIEKIGGETVLFNQKDCVIPE